MIYYTYVLKSEVDHELYIGWTINLKQRIRQHNDGEVGSTSSRRPFNLYTLRDVGQKKKP